MRLNRIVRGYHLIILSLFLQGCQVAYLARNAYDQAALLRQRVPLDQAAELATLSATQKQKLHLVQEVKKFAEGELGLKPSDNYKSFVQLDRPYVTYVLSAAPPYELTHYLWSYPFFGTFPYRGYFRQEYALKEEQEFKQLGYDTFVRGVTAYSTLGWFDDPLYSSMLGYEDHDLVDLIIHETVHTTVYIKSHADFNERLATFFAQKGSAAFYRQQSGDFTRVLALIEQEADDDRIFSTFISQRIENLKDWYLKQKEANLKPSEPERKAQWDAIQTEFATEITPKLKTKKYLGFAKVSLNNARLLNYQTYNMDLSDFEMLFESLGGNFKDFIAFCKNLESESDPINYLKKHLQKIKKVRAREEIRAPFLLDLLNHIVVGPPPVSASG